jgi:cytochrome c556
MGRYHAFLCASLGALACAVALDACGEPAPQFTLQQVMLEIDNGRKDVERLLATSSSIEQVRESVESMSWWSRDPAFDRYVERPDIPANPDRFPALRAEFESRLAALSVSLEKGDEPGARALYPEVVSTCDACHAVYKPDLLSR